MTGHLLPTAVMGALANVVSDRVRAAAGSPLWCVQLAGTYERRRFAATLFVNGGQGAGAKGDGLPTLSFSSNLANTPIEVIESQAPIRIVRRALRPGTGGAGRTRGRQRTSFRVRPSG
jgi:N-methylhydantoinase B